MKIRRFAAALALLAVAACSDVSTAPEGARPSPTGATVRPQSSPLYVDITGPSWITYGTMNQPGPYYEWNAHATGGDGNYTYEWVFSDVLNRTWSLGYGTSTMGSTFDCRWVNFTLTVNVTSAGQTASNSIWVEGLGDGQCEY